MRRRIRPRWFGVAFILAWSLIPLYWVLNISLQTDAQVGSRPAHYFPSTPTLRNFHTLLAGSGEIPGQIRRSALNILGECAAATLVPGLLPTLAAFAFPRMQFRRWLVLLYG